MHIHIRHINQSDLSDVVAIYSFPQVSQNTSQVPYLSREKIARLFEQPDHYGLAAVIDETVVGHVTLIQSPKPRMRHSASIAIAVHPEWHGKGIGKALMAAAIDQADNWLGLLRLELEVHADNEAAIHVYKKAGFETEGVKRMEVFKQGRYTDTVIMARLAPHLSMQFSD